MSKTVSRRHQNGSFTGCACISSKETVKAQNAWKGLDVLGLCQCRIQSSSIRSK